MIQPAAQAPGALAASALVFALVGGCASTHNQKDVAAYRSELDRGLTQQQEAVMDKPQLGVRDVMLLSNLRNEQLEIEGERYVQALIDQRRAAAAFLPTISLAPSYFWRDVAENGRRSGFNTPVDMSLSVNPVRDVAGIQEAGATALERRALLLNFQDALLLDVARAHYEVLRAQRDVSVVENSLAVQNERVNEARVRLEAGLLPPLDLSLARAQAAATETALVEAKLRVQTSRSQLALLTAAQVRDRELVDDVEFDAAIASSDMSQMLEQALVARQDVLAAERRIEAASHFVQAAYGQYFPSVSLNLQYFLQRQSEPTGLDWAGLVQLSLPLFSAGLIEADVRTALSELRQAKSNYSLTMRIVQRDLEVSLENLRASFERIERLKVQFETASDALQQSEGLYNVGLATNIERLVAQDAMLEAERALVNAQFDAKVFYLDLRRTTGSLHELLGLERPDSHIVKR